MQSFSTKLTALTTAIALVVASFVALTHTHSHHGSHSHGGEACCGHHASVLQHDDHGCCHGHDHNHDYNGQSVAVDSSSLNGGLRLANTEHQSHVDHLCALCIFLTQHSADVSPEFHSDNWTCVSKIPDAVAFSPTLSLVAAYYLRGPPQV